MQQVSFPAVGQFGNQILERMWGSVPTDQNYAYSDLALYLALSAAYLGATRESAEELRGLLHLNGKDDLIKLRPLLNRLAQSGVFSIENKVSVGDKIPLKPTYQKLLQEKFGSEVVRSAQSEFLDLISHLTLDALWLNKFDPKETKNAQFQRLDGTSVTVSMMHQKKKMGFGEDDQFKWVILGHKSNSEGTKAPVLMLFLPKAEKNFENAGKLLTQERIQKAYRKADDHDKVILSLPKVFFDSVVCVSKSFENAELKHCFSHQADFSEASEVDIKMKDIHLGVSQSWDEEGNKVEMVARVRDCFLGISENHEMDLSRPFYEVLYDPQTDLVLMRGRIVNPPKAGSHKPGRIPAEYLELLGAPIPSLEQSNSKLSKKIAKRVLESLPGVDQMTHGRFKEIREQLRGSLKPCDSKTLKQMCGFLKGPLNDAISEYAGRIIQATYCLEKWRRIEILRKDMSDAKIEDLKDMLQLLLSEPDYPEPPKVDFTPGNIVEQLEEFLAGLNAKPKLTASNLAGLSEEVQMANTDAIYCLPPEGLPERLKMFEDETDPAKLIALFQEPVVAGWIKTRTKHYTQEVRYKLAELFEPTPEVREAFQKEAKKVLKLREAAKLSPEYFNTTVTEMGRFTYEFGYKNNSEWVQFLNPHTLTSCARYIDLDEASDMPYALTEQYRLETESNGAYKRDLFKHVMRFVMFFNLPWNMQLFLRDVWRHSPAQERLVELYANAHASLKA
jgi:serine protease inhibitor